MHRLLSDIADTNVDVTSMYSTIRKNDVGLSGWDAVNYLDGNVVITKAYMCHIRSTVWRKTLAGENFGELSSPINWRRKVWRIV